MRQRIAVVLAGLVVLTFAAWLPVSSNLPAEPVVKLVAVGSDATIIDISVPGLVTETAVEEGQTFTRLRLPGEPAATGEVGLPQLPRIMKNLGLPSGARVSIEVLEAEEQTFSGILVYPAQQPMTDLDAPSFEIDRQFYSEDVSYPESRVVKEHQATWRGLEFATIGLNPVRYNPARQELTVCSHLRVRVHHPGMPGRLAVEPWMARIYKANIDNFDKLNLDVGWNDGPGVRYLVISHSNYTGGWLDSLVNWHHKRGLESRVIAKSSWTTTEIKDSIKAEYNRHTPATLRWVLLVGEYNEIPAYAYPGVGFSDVWYADVEPPAGDVYFELGVGRFSPSSVADLGNQIQKTLKFQRDPPDAADWFSKSTLAAHSQEYPGKYSACSRGIYNFPYGYYHYTFDTVFGGAGGTNAMVTSDINEGRVVVNYRGHGSETAWTGWASGGGSWTASEINALTNGDMTPVVFNCCCLNHVLSTATCLGEAWMRKYPGGAVASLGATEASYTIPNHGWDSTLYRSLGDTFTISVPGVRDYTCPTWDIGWVQANADAYIQKYYASQGGTENAEMYLWLGDPALGVWTGKPLAPDVTHAPVVPLGSYNLDVTVMRQGAPVANALVCAWKQGEFYVTGYTNGSGQASLAIEALTPGTFPVTVTGHTILPYEGTCEARTSNTAYVVYQKHFVNDSAPRGNGDGCVNPGETIIMPTWVKNLGDSTGRTVNGKLRCSDGWITLQDTAKAFGNVLPHDSAWTGALGFRFAVASACTNGHSVKFTLQCRDNLDSIWNSNIYIRVGAPNLEYASIEAIDTCSGGNRNGRLDPNETCQLVVSLRNKGFGHASGVTAILRSGDGRLVVTDSFGDFGLIMAESTKANALDRFKVVTGNMPAETQIPCTLRISAAGGYAQVIPFRVVVGQIRQIDPIPDGPRQPPLYYSYDDSDTGYVQHPEYSWVEIKTQGTRLNFSHNDEVLVVTLPTGFGPVKYYGERFTQVSISADGWIVPGNYTTTNFTNTALPSTGAPPRAVCANWDDLYPGYGSAGYAYWYHDAANHRFVVEFDSSSYYSPTSLKDKFEFIFYDTTLAATDGNTQFKMQYMTANGFASSTIGMQDGTQQIGIQCLFDNSYHRGCAPIATGRAIWFTTEAPITAVAEPGPGALPERVELATRPNPLRSRALLSYALPVAGRVKLAVYDLTGSLVRTLVNATEPAGRKTLAWDRTDDAGRKLAAGVYLVRLDAAGQTRTGKLVVQE